MLFCDPHRVAFWSWDLLPCPFVGGQNFFKEFTGQLGQSGESGLQPRGGHRLWMAPEDPVKSYAPGNGTVRIDVQGLDLSGRAPGTSLP